ncbi:MAG: penicillin-binding protein 2, partial [Clostridiaceae bacterium]|nr:penicillin-binding protein 2 [Clostridiaceae bacterium]
MYNGNNIFGNSNYKDEVRKRLWIMMIIFMVFFCLLIWKISNYMYFRAEPLKAMFNAQYTIDEKYGMPYKLLDCNGNNLLNYEMKYTAVIDPVDYFRFNEYTSKYDMEALSITLRNYNKNYDLDKIKDNGSFEKVRYIIDKVTFDKIKDIVGVTGFYAYEANEVINSKNWKIENLISNPLELENSKPKSADSLEMQIYNKTKSNEYEKIRFVKGVDGDIAEGKIIYPQNNINVKLTLDKEIQGSVEAILHKEIYKKYKQIGVVLMESQTGKIRAMAQKDDTLYNANLGIKGTSGAYPGSIFKVIVEEAGIDLDFIDIYKKYELNSELFTDEHSKGKDNYTAREALTYSSNNIFAQFGFMIGGKNIYNYAEKQGLLGKVLNFHDEESGKFEVELLNSKFIASDISQASIGQNIRITPLAAISIPSTIINNGVYVKPSIIDSYVNDNNETIESTTPKTSTVVKRETAEEIKLAMMDVVTIGTGRQAYIEGMDIGGKTGTTEYTDEGEKCSDGW